MCGEPEGGVLTDKHVLSDLTLRLELGVRIACSRLFAKPLRIQGPLGGITGEGFSFYHGRGGGERIHRAQRPVRTPRSCTAGAHLAWPGSQPLCGTREPLGTLAPCTALKHKVSW